MSVIVPSNHSGGHTHAHTYTHNAARGGVAEVDDPTRTRRAWLRQARTHLYVCILCCCVLHCLADAPDPTILRHQHPSTGYRAGQASRTQGVPRCSEGYPVRWTVPSSTVPGGPPHRSPDGDQGAGVLNLGRDVCQAVQFQVGSYPLCTALS